MGRDARLKRERLGAKNPPPARWLSRRTRRRLRAGLILLLLTAGGVAGSWWWTSRPGATAPPFALPASTGETVRLEDYRGKQPVVLVFYMAGT
jgi:hypothetical protein